MKGYIYKIINKNDNKIYYIGQTMRDLETRFQEHVFDIERYDNRLLYQKFKEKGINNFKIELVETIENSKNNIEKLLNEREKYWINYYDTYNNGCNETHGGSGRNLLNLNIDDVINMYKQNNNINKIADKFNCSHSMIWTILIENNIINKNNNPRSPHIAQYDIDDNLIHIFNNTDEICKELNIKYKSHIFETCNNKRLSAYGYKWRYV